MIYIILLIKHKIQQRIKKEKKLQLTLVLANPEGTEQFSSL